MGSRASTTYQTESHTKHTVIDVSLDQAQFEMNEAKAKEAKSTSPRNKMVIKIYPPSLQAVASKSPSGQDQQRYFDLIVSFLFLLFFFRIFQFLNYIFLFFSHVFCFY